MSLRQWQKLMAASTANAVRSVFSVIRAMKLFYLVGRWNYFMAVAGTLEDRALMTSSASLRVIFSATSAIEPLNLLP